MKRQITHNVFIIFVWLLSPLSMAHNVLGGVYAIGKEVEGEIGFSNGDMAPAGSIVLVSDAQRNTIVTLQTDEEGFFTFTASRRVDHYFYANLGAGHVFETVLKAEELSDELGDIETIKPLMVNSSNISDAPNNELQAMIEKAVAKQIKPLRQELNTYKEQASLQDVLGGIGYIFGLCGIGYGFAQRQQKNNSQVKKSAAES